MSAETLRLALGYLLGFAIGAGAGAVIYRWCTVLLRRRGLMHGETMPPQAERSPTQLRVLQVQLEERIRELSRANVVLQREISQRAHMESELRKTLDHQKQIRSQQRDVVSMVSHQFRTPLAVVDAAAQSIASYVVESTDHRTNEVVFRRLQKIRRACDRLTSLLDNCLTDDRMNTGVLLAQKSEIDISQLVARVAEQASAFGRDRVDFSASRTPIQVHGDEPALGLMIANLIQNALAYSGNASRVVITSEVAESRARISVLDHGPGIAPEAQPFIFDKYFRGQMSQAAGAGLGLHIAREIARAHGGDIVLEASSNRGSIFVATLPLT